MLAVTAAAVAVLASPAYGKTCAQKVIDDWSDNGHVDSLYPVHCYREAIAALPEDAAAYSSAADDIRRALQDRLRNEGTGGGGSGGSSGGGATTGGASSSGGTGSTGTRDGAGVTGETGETAPAEGSGEDGGGAPAATVETDPEQGSGEDGSAVDSGTSNAGGGSDGSAGDAGTVAAPSEEAFGGKLGSGGGGSLPLPLVIVIAALGVLAAAWAAKIALGRRVRPIGGPSEGPSDSAGD